LLQIHKYRLVHRILLNNKKQLKINGQIIIIHLCKISGLRIDRSIDIDILYFSSFTTILDSCLGSLSASVPKHTFEQSLHLPFRSDQAIQYESINWQNESSAPVRFIVQPTSPNQMLKISNEPNNANQTNTDVIRDDDEENQAPKVVIKKKTKKKKQIPQVNPTETTTDSAAVLNTSSNRTSTTGYKYHVNRSIFFVNQFCYC